jgi:hypothetical protein
MDWDNTTLLGDTLDEYELLGYQKSSTAYYVVCAHCNEVSDDLKSSFADQAQLYKDELKRTQGEVGAGHNMAEAEDEDESSHSSDVQIVETTHVFRSRDPNITSVRDLDSSRRSSIAPSLTDISTGVTASGITTPNGGGSFVFGALPRKGKRKSAMMAEEYFEDDSRNVKSKLEGGSELGSLHV